jgi:hypothetical protein
MDGRITADIYPPALPGPQAGAHGLDCWSVPEGTVFEEFICFGSWASSRVEANTSQDRIYINEQLQYTGLAAQPDWRSVASSHFETIGTSKQAVGRRKQHRRPRKVQLDTGNKTNALTLRKENPEMRTLLAACPSEQRARLAGIENPGTMGGTSEGHRGFVIP